MPFMPTIGPFGSITEFYMGKNNSLPEKTTGRELWEGLSCLICAGCKINFFSAFAAFMDLFKFIGENFF
jgi:hypothetical protein